jgi:methylated-DNA-protein-cysteine methyltransferase related protein
MMQRPSPHRKSTQADRTANFYQQVYALVAQIPSGQVATYGQIARLLGHPSAARAVGYALRALPNGSDIPWQRVINASGRISTRGNPHSEAIQRVLLEAEGVRFGGGGTINLRACLWRGPLHLEQCGRREPH